MQPGGLAPVYRNLLEPRKARAEAAAGVPSPGGIGPAGEHAAPVVLAVASRHRRDAARCRTILYGYRVVYVWNVYGA